MQALGDNYVHVLTSMLSSLFYLHGTSNLQYDFLILVNPNDNPRLPRNKMALERMAFWDQHSKSHSTLPKTLAISSNLGPWNALWDASFGHLS